MINRFGKHLTLFFLFAGFSLQLCNAQLKSGQGYAELRGGRVWYDIIGESGKTPLLILHGGPGGATYSLFPLAYLSDERQVILFDQPGGGRSDYISDTSLMTMEFFVEQLKELRDYFGLKDYYLYGHSWGTMLGLDFYLQHPEGIKALILNSPLVSTRIWELDADTLISTLPDSIQQAILTNEEQETFDSPSYQQAISFYYHSFIRRSPRIKTEFDVPAVAGNNKIYRYMWGPSEFTPRGTLRNYDRLDRLDEIKVPTLFITGEFDEARPSTVKYYHSLVPNSEFKVIPGAAHATMHDNPNDNIAAIREFLHAIEIKTGEE